MQINGVLIDCSRLMEQHNYYYRLIDFMSEWKMNALVLHFSDDYGCAVQLPGFENIAIPNAFSCSEIRKLISYAAKRGIDIIPELEVFGHIYYLTDHPKYARLLVGRKTRKLKLNAVEPLNPDTIKVMQCLIKAVAKVFLSKYMHLGCDEVDIKDYCKNRGLNEADVWADYVNQMICITRNCGKIPIIWADHLANKQIAKKLRKDVILVEWCYEKNINRTVIPKLKKVGFKDVIVGPSLACSLYRFLPTEIALENTKRMAGFAVKHKVMGLINTIWCPWRYLQNALYYGIAYSSRIVGGSGKIDMRKFHKEFAQKVFGTDLASALSQFLNAWPKLNITHSVSKELVKRNPEFSGEQKRQLEKVNTIGKKLLVIVEKYAPEKNYDIWNAMVLAARAAWLCSEWYMLNEKSDSIDIERKKAYNMMLRQVRKDLSEEWDRTRFSNDPQKYRTKFPDDSAAYVMILMQRVPYIK